MVDREALRTWGPVLLVVVLLPAAFVGLRAVLPPIRKAPTPAPETEDPAPTGSAGCASCHATQVGAWEGSRHAEAERALPVAGLPERPEVDGTGGAVRVIGVEPVVQYLVPADGGRLQVTQVAWDPGEGEWFEVFADRREPGDWGHWTGAGMNWNSQCASCHVTGLDKGWDEATGTYATTFDALGVGCAACHGDPEAHAAGGAPPRVPPDRVEDVCASCHSRRAELTGAFTPGDALLDHFAPVGVDPTDTFWPDGQVREEDFEWGAFVGSRMHAAGVTCTSCHDPHSGATVRPGDALCTGCHAAMPGFADHDPHPDAAAPTCVDCHLSANTYMARDARHGHHFGIPDPWLTVRHGIPSTCVGACHADRDPAWAAGAAGGWWDLDGPRRQRADLLARGRAGDPSAVPGLVALLGSTEAPAWRAAAAALLGGFPDRLEVRAALSPALADPEARVRFEAVGALGPAAGDAAVPLLRDPVRAVRVAAGRALRGRYPPGSPSLGDYEAYLARSTDQPAGRLERGTWWLEHGRAGRAVADLRAAVALDPNAVAARDALAVALSTDGRPREARDELRVAVTLEPDDAELWFRLGLAEAGVGDLAAAERALADAVARDPGLGRAWYNLALLRAQLGRPDAVDAARRAEALAPDDAEVAYAVASVLHQAGRAAEAKAQARRVLVLAPGHPGATAVLAAP